MSTFLIILFIIIISPLIYSATYLLNKIIRMKRSTMHLIELPGSYQKMAQLNYNGEKLNLLVDTGSESNLLRADIILTEIFEKNIHPDNIKNMTICGIDGIKHEGVTIQIELSNNKKIYV